MRQKPPVVKEKNRQGIAAPEAFIIQELNEQRRGTMDSISPHQPIKNIDNELQYWPPKREEAQGGLIIIEL